jgi:hypothetical protein
VDFPKSVPSVGLVDGKFVDEDPLAGTPGSLIPAQWGNAVTEEILNVISSAGLEPDELANNQLVAAISQIIGATRPFATQAEAEAGVDNTKSMTAVRTQQAISKRAAIVGSSRNVRMTVTVASATATLTADEIFVKSSLGGSAWLLSSFNKTLNLASNGAGGMDTGVAPTSGYVSVYAIYNPTTGVSALLACSQATSNGPVYSGANMPAGYTASALVSSWGTTAGGLLRAGAQVDRLVSFTAISALNTSTAAGTFTLFTLAGAVPLNAISYFGYFGAVSTLTGTLGLVVAATSGGFGAQNVNNSGTQVTTSFSIPITSPQQSYYVTASTSGTPTFSVNVTGYTF